MGEWRKLCFPHSRILLTRIDTKNIILNEEGSVTTGNVQYDTTHRRFKHGKQYSILLTDIHPRHKSIKTGTQIKTTIFLEEEGKEGARRPRIFCDASSL